MKLAVDTNFTIDDVAATMAARFQIAELQAQQPVRFLDCRIAGPCIRRPKRRQRPWEKAPRPNPPCHLPFLPPPGGPQSAISIRPAPLPAGSPYLIASRRRPQSGPALRHRARRFSCAIDAP